MTAEQIKTEIARYWNAFNSKSAGDLEEFYAHECSVFSTSGTRSEPGRLAAARRKREYFAPQTTVRVALGPVEVTVLGDVAVASYTFKLQASKVASVTGKQVDEEIEHGRATQVFTSDAEGGVHIVHEHFSVAAQQ